MKIPDPFPGVQKQCFCDRFDYWNMTQYNKDKEVWELKEKKEEEEKAAKEQEEEIKQSDVMMNNLVSPR